MPLGLCLLFIFAVVAANYAENHQVLNRALVALLGLGNLLVAVVAGGGLFVDHEASFDGLSSVAVQMDAFLRLPLFLASLAALALLLPPVRRRLSRVIRISPDSSVHLLALTVAVYFVALTAPLAALGLEPERFGGLPAPLSTWDLALSSTMLLIVAVTGVGFPIRRSWHQTLARLKLEPVTVRQMLWGLLTILGLLALDRTVVWLWSVYLPDNYALVQEFNVQLFTDLMTPLGGAFIGIAAGLSEEILFRGAVQPCFGLVITSALFALAHLQYAFSPALAEVLIVGVALGLLRRRSSTTVCILVHAGYNFADILIMVAGNGL